MKRLTKKIGKHSSFYDCDIICNQCFNGCKVTQKVFDRLAAYEDTGLDPEDIIELKDRMEGWRNEHFKPNDCVGRKGKISDVP